MSGCELRGETLQDKERVQLETEGGGGHSIERASAKGFQWAQRRLDSGVMGAQRGALTMVSGVGEVVFAVRVGRADDESGRWKDERAASSLLASTNDEFAFVRLGLVNTF